MKIDTKRLENVETIVKSGNRGVKKEKLKACQTYMNQVVYDNVQLFQDAQRAASLDTVAIDFIIHREKVVFLEVQIKMAHTGWKLELYESHFGVKIQNPDLVGAFIEMIAGDVGPPHLPYVDMQKKNDDKSINRE
ncbi:unnamed protein product [marine sediment metagenome]|uniref:Uncharacterized protein n=1 Tax=marine sediment metagenome TaxID=412755 RepID=X1PLS2_9ZZZZ